MPVHGCGKTLTLAAMGDKRREGISDVVVVFLAEHGLIQKAIALWPVWSIISVYRYYYRYTDMTKDTNKIRLDIVEKVRRLRQENRWTQARLAHLLGFSQNRLSEIERGRGSFTA